MRKPLLIVILITIFAMGLNNLPVVMGYVTQKDNLVYLGRRDINSQDVYTYVAFIEQARQGRVLFENLYMPEHQTPSLIRPSYLFIGVVARLLNLSSIAAYHVFRIIFSLLFCWILFVFLKRFFVKDRDRVIAYAVVLLSAGIGAFIKGLAPNTTDLWIPESITFLSMAEAPHFILSQTLMLLGFLAFFKAIEKKKMQYFLFSAASFLLLSFEHPFNLFVTGASIGALTLYQLTQTKANLKNVLLGYGLILLVIFLGLFYQWYETIQNPILRSWMKESLLLSPSPHNFIYGYGLLLVFALFGIEKALREKQLDRMLLVFWIGAAALLLYSPIPFQRRFSEGLHIPLAIFASMGLITVSEIASKLSIKAAQKYAFYAVLVFSMVVLSATPIERVLNDISVISSDSQQGYYYHLLSAEVAAIQYLGKTTNSGDIILTNWFYGNLIPGMAGRKVYLGHKVQTPFFDRKVEDMNKFLLETDPAKAKAFIKQAGFTYIFLGKNDTILQYGFKPDSKSYLQKMYDKGGVAIYKVK